MFQGKNDISTMTWLEYRERTCDVLILPVGSTEQHGPHLPLGVDSLLATHFAHLLAPLIGGVVAPALQYGYKSKPFSGGGPLFPGTVDLQGSTLQHLTMDLLEEFSKDGFTKIFLLNAHFENEAFLAEAMDIIDSRLQGKITMILSNWWDPLPEDVLHEVFDVTPFPGWALEHAAVTETSLMLYFCPDLVHMERAIEMPPFAPPSYTLYPLSQGMLPKTGVLASAKGASAAKGELIAQAVLPKLAAMANASFARSDLR